MIISSSKDIMIFYQERKKCKELYYNVDFPVCRATSRICDEDYCPYIKAADFIDDFIDAINKK